MKNIWKILLVLVMVFGFSGVAKAALITIGTATYSGQNYNLIYEDDQDLVWLDFSKSASGGNGNWGGQNSWASTLGSNLTITLNPGYNTTIDWATGWRLPSAGDNPMEDFYDTSGEMGHLYYVSLGNKAGGFAPYTTGLFANLQRTDYWLGTLYSADNRYAWYYNFNTGYLSKDFTTALYPALAVHPGVVSAVPVPASLLLLASGLSGLLLIGRLKGMLS
jgi:hypothetical protein